MRSVNNMGYVPETDEHGSYIFNAIRKGLEPFKPRTVNLYFEFDIDHNRYVLFAEVWFPDYSIRHRVDINAWDLARDEELEMYKAANKMLEGFRNREAYPLSNNLHLGEE